MQVPPIRGDDVKMLQAELQQLGYAIPSDEMASGSFGRVTCQAVLEFQTTHGLETTGTVDERTALLITRALDLLHPQPEPGRLLLQGLISDQNTHAVTGVVVRVFEKGMRSEELLGETRTDEHGHYEIAYTAGQIHRPEAGPPDLMVRVFNPDGQLLGASPTLFDAPAVATIDLVISAPEEVRLSEYAEVLGEITPVLEGVNLADLTDQDMDFLFGETRIDRQRLEFLDQAAKLSKKTNVPTEAFYGWARENLSLTLVRLLALPDEDLRSALEKAIDKNIVPAELRQSLDNIMRQVDALRSATTSPTLTELVSTLHLDVPAPLSLFLAEHGISTLADIRKAGGIGALDGLPVPADSETVRVLEAHANLSMLSSDVKANAALIHQGFDSIFTIANAPRAEFVSTAHEVVGDFQAAKMHVMAAAETKFLSNIWTGHQADFVNGYQADGDGGLDVSPQQCSCRECEAAVSPIAYLADLLSYALKNVKTTSGIMSLSFLASELLYQPFDELLASCEEAGTQVRQVRLCIEVLRRFLAANKLTLSQDAEKNYLMGAYRALLNRVGTSYEEIRLAPTADGRSRSDLADRLGINHNGSLDELLLDPGALTGAALERLFGLATTDRYPLSDGIMLGDSQNQIRRWNLEGVEWGANTDDEGITYVTLKKTNGVVRIELYHDAQRKELVAAGDRPTDSGPIAVVEEQPSGLSGRVDVAYSADSTDIRFVALPKVLAWRLRRLRDIWKGQDRPSNFYADLPASLTLQEKAALPPIIDPDVVGPDDFRVPFLKLDQKADDRPFDVWLRRRVWVDGRLDELSKTNKDIGMMLSSMSNPIKYASLPDVTPWTKVLQPDDLDALFEDLGRADTAERAKKTIRADLHLTPESFSRLVALRGKDQRKEKMTDDEWSEIHSILVQAQKVAFFPTWRDEEQTLKVTLGSQHFWISLRQPKGGTWPPLMRPGPLVDPDLVKLDELPEPTAGRRILAMWRSRRLEIDGITQNLENAQKNGGFDAMLKLALGDPLPDDLVKLYSDIKNNVDVTDIIANDLHMTVEDFTRFMDLKAKNDDSGPQKQPLTEAEWAEVIAILTSAQKRRQAYGKWAKEEITGIEYWAMFKATLPLWRASAEIRQGWQGAFRVRCQAPLVDPHVIDLGDLRNPAPKDPAYDLWSARMNWAVGANGKHDELENIRKAAPTELAGLDAALIKAVFADDTLQAIKAQLQSDRIIYGLDYVLKEVLGDPLPDLVALLADLANPETRRTVATSLYLTPDDFKELVSIWQGGGLASDADDLLARAVLVKSLMGLEEENEKGNDITGPLEQLGLTLDAFDFLVRMRKLVANDATLESSEWTDGIENILVQVQKRRAFAGWRDEEKAKELALSPDFFKFPEFDLTLFPPPPPVRRQAWLATEEARRDWQGTLQARIDQQKSVIDALEQAVSAVEEAVLPELRDALVLASGQGNDLNTKAKWITDHLLIDAKADGCQMTTRVAQAIETIQALVFGIRTGQLQHAYPNLELVADQFEEEWQWIGSYATWRAAMFVFLYPENILIPSLRKWKTPAFRTLVSDLRANRNLTPGQACEAAAEYAEYLRDVCNLSLEATCQAETLIHRGEGCDRASVDSRDLLYMFARGGATQHVYWSAYDPADATPYAQTFWSDVPGLANAKVLKVLGAVPYRVSPERRFVFLFAQTEEKGKEKLLLMRYDLQKQTWVGEPTELDLPQDGKGDTISFTAVVMQQDQEMRPPRLVIQVPAGAIYSRQLDKEGKNWTEAEGDSDKIPLVPRLIGIAYTVCAMVEIAPDEFYLLAQSAYTGYVSYRLFGSRDDGYWRNLPDRAPFKGAFSWPGTPDVYVYWGDDLSAYYRVIKRSDVAVGSKRIDALKDFDDWLALVTGTSLHTMVVPDGLPGAGENIIDFLNGNPNGQDKRKVINTIAAKISGDGEEWQDWKWTDRLVKEFAITITGVDISNPSLMNVVYYVGPKTGVDFRQRTIEHELNPSPYDPAFPAVNEIALIDPTCWAVDANEPAPPAKLLAYVTETGSTRGLYRCTFERLEDDSLKEIQTARVAPVMMALDGGSLLRDPYEITPILSEDERQLRRSDIAEVYMVNADDGLLSNVIYVEEAYYFVPIHLALLLQQGGQYAAALDWFRIVYDYSVPIKNRKIYSWLKAEEKLPAVYKRADGWLLDPLNPHAIAETRALTYTRFTVLALVRCLLEFADAEFTRDTAESVPRARMLYMTALELLDVPELKQELHGCDILIGQVNIDVGDPQWAPVFVALRNDLAGIAENGTLVKTVEKFNRVMTSGDPLGVRFDKVKQIIRDARASIPATPCLGLALQEGGAMVVRTHAALLREPVLVQAVEGVGQMAADDFRQAVAAVSKIPAERLERDRIDIPWLRDGAGAER